jgi:hypothetical protein
LSTLGVGARDLNFERVGEGRQQTLDAQRPAIREREGAAPVEVRIVQEIGAGGRVGHDCQPPLSGGSYVSLAT